MIHHTIRRVGFALGVAAWVAAPFAYAQDAGPLQLSPAQMQEAAKLAAQSGDMARAVAFADALLTRDPQDVNAHLIRAYALRAQGRYAPAQEAARSAWRLAGSAEQKYNAALVMAQALSSDGKRTRAQFWLRRAVEHAPSPGHARRATRDFKYVRQRNPWQTHLSFTLAPNSNINNGSSRDSFLSDSVLDRLVGGGPTVREINPEAQALSGIEIGGQVQSRYRFAQSERRAHDLRLGLSYRTYALSQDSKDQVPDARGRDYAFGSASIGYGFKHLRADRRGELSLGVDLGQTFYGGARYASFLRGHADQSYFVDQRTKLRFGLVAEVENGQRVSDSESVSVSFGVDRALSGGSGVHLGLTVADQKSPNALHEYSLVRLRGGYLLGREVMGAQVQIGLGAALRDYDVHLLSVDGRRDVEISFDVTATFRDIDYYGFTPQVSLTGAKTNSNIGVYDSNRLGLNIGIVSAF
ncbi:surface lipoprotein assembly modifier [Sulfitobacter sp. HNIBRBA3233]|uniref:surface lipoprotein assembly modifier n=1 Tax=Sulfitobacter marinivivus TaxID=3158558 RepID=UPI0032DE5AB1